MCVVCVYGIYYNVIQLHSLGGGGMAICIQQLLDIGPGIGKHFCKCSSS